MKANKRDGWKLESFLDSLILELDKAQDTLSVKGVTRKLTYTVKDVALDLHVFPQYENDGLRFNTAKPGEEGASKISFQLGSITDRQIRETTNEPISAEDVSIETIEGVDDEVKDSLKKVGVHSSRDLERLKRRNVDLEKVVAVKGANKKVDYQSLANLINKARRRNVPPRMMGIQATSAPLGTELTLRGENLVLDMGKVNEGYPKVLVNNNKTEVVAADSDAITVRIAPGKMKRGVNSVQLALDPYALVELNVNAEQD